MSGFLWQPDRRWAWPSPVVAGLPSALPLSFLPSQAGCQALAPVMGGHPRLNALSFVRGRLRQRRARDEVQALAACGPGPNPFAPSFTHLLSTGGMGSGQKESGVNCSARGTPSHAGGGGVSEPSEPPLGAKVIAVSGLRVLMVKDEGEGVVIDQGTSMHIDLGRGYTDGRGDIDQGRGTDVREGTLIREG